MSERFWTDQRTYLLKLMWGYATATKIANEIGCTRNMVIGKAHRLGLKLAKSEVARRRCLTPAPSEATRQRMSSASTANWANPEIRKRMMAAARRTREQRQRG